MAEGIAHRSSTIETGQLYLFFFPSFEFQWYRLLETNHLCFSFLDRRIINGIADEYASDSNG